MGAGFQTPPDTTELTVERMHQQEMHISTGHEHSAPAGVAGRLRRLVYLLRTEGAGSGREAVAIGLGVFVGCLPLYGLHLAICWALGWLFRLNRLKLYLAANISNPAMAPLLLLVELEIGALIRRGRLQALTLDAVRASTPGQFGLDLVVGSLAAGVALGAAAGLATWALMRRGESDPVFARLVRRASDRYVGTSITAWEFARGKLRNDPLYRTALFSGVLPSGGVLIDVGCGQGLMLALLAEVRRDAAAGAAAGDAPVFDVLIGVEMRPRVASLARRALGADARIAVADARCLQPEDCRAVLFFDVLHMLPAADQETLVAAMAARLSADGVMLVRETDAAAGWRFRTVRAGNRLKALAAGRWRQTFHFRTAAGWTALFERAGFDVRTLDTGAGTPFGNVLFVLTRPDRASART